MFHVQFGWSDELRQIPSLEVCFIDPDVEQDGIGSAVHRHDDRRISSDGLMCDILYLL
jgi:hypothetical protein